MIQREMPTDPDGVEHTPDSKVHGANMGPTWGRQDPGGPHVGPMNFAIWDTLHSWLNWWTTPNFVPCEKDGILATHKISHIQETVFEDMLWISIYKIVIFLCCYLLWSWQMWPLEIYIINVKYI